jgi:hypothetical protein
MATDKFTQTYDALWSALTGNAEWAALVQPSNRESYTGIYARTVRPGAQPADSPMVRLAPAGCTVLQAHTNWKFQQRWQLLIRAPDLQLDGTFFPLKMATYKALYQAGSSLGLTFVANLIIRAVVEDITTAMEADGGTAGWIALMDLETTINVTTTELGS